MSFEYYRPVLSGVVGGILAVVVCKLMARWVPRHVGAKGRTELMLEYRPVIWLCNGLHLAGLMGCVASIHSGTFSKTDLHPLLLGLGFGSFATLIVLPLFATMTRRSPREAYVAYSMSQQTPMYLLYGILVVLSVGFVGAAVDLWIL